MELIEFEDDVSIEAVTAPADGSAFPAAGSTGLPLLAASENDIVVYSCDELARAVKNATADTKIALEGSSSYRVTSALR